MRFPLLLVVLLAFGPARASEPGFADFEDFASRYRAASSAERDAVAASFVAWQRSRGGFPVIEKEGAVFVWSTSRPDTIRGAGIPSSTPRTATSGSRPRRFRWSSTTSSRTG